MTLGKWIVYNATQVSNASGTHDSVVTLDKANGVDPVWWRGASLSGAALATLEMQMGHPARGNAADVPRRLRPP